MRRTPAALALLAALAALPACDRRPAAEAGGDTLPRERFVAANVALRSIPDSTTGVDSVRAAALAELDVSADQLKQFVRRHGTRTGFMAEVWTEIADSIRAQDSTMVNLRRHAAEEPMFDDPMPRPADTRPPPAPVRTLDPAAAPPSAGGPAARAKPEPPPSAAPTPAADPRARVRRPFRGSETREGDTARIAPEQTPAAPGARR